MKHLKGLDTLRAFAVIIVVIAHWGPSLHDNRPIGLLINRLIVPDGATGVYIFFTLSGFLITSILLNARFELKEANRFVIIKNFIARRTLRIFPIYYVFLFVLIHLFDTPDVRRDLPWFLTYTSNILLYRTNTWNFASHTWTLAVEEQFYLFWPWVILFLNEKYLKHLFFVVIITGSITTFFVLKNHMEPFMVYNCMDAFGIGGFYAYARLNAKHTEWFEKTIKRLVPFLLLIYVFWKVEVFALHKEHFIFLKKTVESLLAVWLIILIINNRSVWVKKHLLENKVLNFIGRISYCMYLIHPYIDMFNDGYARSVRKTLMKYPAIAGIMTGRIFIYCYNVALLILLCWLSYVLIEQPILSLKRFFKYNKREAV